MFKRLSLPGVLLFAALAFFSAPSQPVLASECGELGGPLCSEQVDCRRWWIFRWGCKAVSWTYYTTL